MAEQLISTAEHDTLPDSYVRPQQRPRLGEVVSRVAEACRTHGFFQVLNHGIDASLIAPVMAVGRDFFRLPVTEKAKLYSDEPACKTVHNWGDYLQLHDGLPLQQLVPD